MTIRFNGIVEEQVKGCKPCGKAKTVRRTMATTKQFVLPSGQFKTFRAGKTYTLDDTDAHFLLGYSYVDTDGTTKRAFEVV